MAPRRQKTRLSLWMDTELILNVTTLYPAKDFSKALRQAVEVAIQAKLACLAQSPEKALDSSSLSGTMGTKISPR